jgi:hypothetical protein
MTRKQTSYKLKIVGHESKEWTSIDKDGLEWRNQSFFPLSKGVYSLIKQGTHWYLKKTFGDDRYSSIVLYKEIIDTLLDGRTVEIDEDIIAIK